MKLNTTEEKKTPQKVASGNGKATLNKGFEKNNFRSFFQMASHDHRPIATELKFWIVKDGG